MISKVLRDINALKRTGIIKDYAISGAIAVMYYAQPRETRDFDIMVLTHGEADYEEVQRQTTYFFRSRGYRVEGDDIMVGRIPVQFFQVSSGLDGESVNRAKRVVIQNVRRSEERRVGKECRL